jgi:hypothetical protein
MRQMVARGARNTRQSSVPCTHHCSICKRVAPGVVEGSGDPLRARPMTPTTRFGGIRFAAAALCAATVISSSHFRPVSTSTSPVTTTGRASYDWRAIQQQLPGRSLSVLIDVFRPRIEDVYFVTGCDFVSIVAIFFDTGEREVFVWFVTPPPLSSKGARERWPHWCQDVVIDRVSLGPLRHTESE